MSFIDDLEKTVRNLPGVFADWGTIDPELRQHYGEELTLMLTRLPQEQERLARARAALIRMTFHMAATFGFKPMEAIAIGESLAKEPAPAPPPPPVDANGSPVEEET